MTDGPGQQPQPPQEPPTSAAEGEREVLEGRVIPSRPQPRHASSQAPQQPQPPYADDPRRQFRQPPGQAEPQAPASGPAWGASGPGAVQAGPGATQAAPGGAGYGPPAETLPATTRRTPAGPAQAPQAGPAPVAPGRPAQGAPGRPGQGIPAQGIPGQGGRPQGAPVPPPAPAPAPAAPPQGAPGMGTHRQPFARQQAQQGPPSASSGPSSRQEQRRQRQQPPSPPVSGPGAAPVAGTPDWGALAEQEAARAARRRKLLMLAGGAVAVAVIAGGVATAVVMSGNSSDSAPIAGPSSGTSSTATQSPLPPAPSFSSVAPPPPPNPLDFISTAAKDTAPISPATLFPGKQFKLGGRTYAKTTSTVTTKCATGARSDLATALAANGCRELIRVTYTQGGVAVTVGVAVFDDKAHAAKVQKTAHYLGPLNGGGVKDFCHGVSCQMTSNAVGRYAYFAISGLKSGKTLTPADKTARQAANDASDFAFQRIIQRGRDAATAATP